MMTEERFANILQMLEKERSVTVRQLCDALGASESTIRRDLSELDSQGRIKKLHGGAALPDSPFAQFLTGEDSMVSKETVKVEEKRSIGGFAASMLTAGDFVFVDAGSTTLQVCAQLGGEGLKATFVTNGIAHARTLAQKGCKVYVLSGQVRPNTEAIVGVSAVQSLLNYHFTKAFMGTNGVSVNHGFTTPDPEEATLKKIAVERAMETWFLADDSKFGRAYAAIICPLTDAAILTNRLPNEKYRQYVLIKETEEK